MIDIKDEYNGPVYLREVEIRYKKKRVANEAADATINSPGDVVKLFRSLQDETKEKLIAVNLDSKHRILCFEVVAIGSINSIYVRPMEVFRTAFPVSAHGVVVLHNHPSGDPAPSESDKTFTTKLDRLAQDMGLKFIDHIIIGHNSYFSFQESTKLITTGL